MREVIGTGRVVRGLVVLDGVDHVEFYDVARDWIQDAYEEAQGGDAGRMPQWSDEQVERLIARMYQGGWAQFIKDGD